LWVVTSRVAYAGSSRRSRKAANAVCSAGRRRRVMRLYGSIAYGAHFQEGVWRYAGPVQPYALIRPPSWLARRWMRTPNLTGVIRGFWVSSFCPSVAGLRETEHPPSAPPPTSSCQSIASAILTVGIWRPAANRFVRAVAVGAQ